MIVSITAWLSALPLLRFSSYVVVVAGSSVLTAWAASREFCWNFRPSTGLAVLYSMISCSDFGPVVVPDRYALRSRWNSYGMTLGTLVAAPGVTTVVVAPSVPSSLTAVG